MENFVDNSENGQSDIDAEMENAEQIAADVSMAEEEPSSTDDDSEQSMEELMEMYEESLKQFEEGEVVIGTIISVDRDHVLVDVGYKSEGQIPIHEFKDENGQVDVHLNDKVEVMIEVWDEDEERVILSKEKAAKVKVWEAIKEIHEADSTIEGVITNRVKGGFSVDVGVQAFLPGSQADLRPIRNLDEMVGKSFDFKVLKFNRKRNNIVLSRRAILEAERESKRSATLASIEEGKVLEGIVKNITEYGIFVDLGGVDGLLHITDISWGRVKHPSELYGIGETINVKILSFDQENERVSLGMKQLVPDPWTTAEERYPVGSRVNGKVVSLTDYGAFVEVEEGIEGLIHVSEMSWTRKVRHPSKVVSAGEIVEAVVLDIKPENRRISLGMKQISPNPWEMISEKYPIGSTIEGKIKNITDFGVFIGIDDDIDGLVHISDISWIKRIKHPSELYKKGDMVQARVLDIDKANERFSLGIKQLEDDPWKSVAERYPAGTEINGTITNVTDFGIFLELEEGIEGLVHVSEISKEKIKTPVGQYEVGDSLTAKVMNINTEERRIGLSVKRLDMDDDQSILEEYVNKAQAAPSSFGEILKENLQEKLNGQVKTIDAVKEEVEGAAKEAVEETAEPVAEEVADAPAESVVDVTPDGDAIAKEVVETDEEPVAEEVVVDAPAEPVDVDAAPDGDVVEEEAKTDEPAVMADAPEKADGESGEPDAEAEAPVEASTEEASTEEASTEEASTEASEEVEASEELAVSDDATDADDAAADTEPEQES